MTHDPGCCRVGVTGHRKLGEAEAWVDAVLRRWFRDLRVTHGDRLVAVSAVAVGADTLFAEAALALGIRLEVVIPYAGYADDFPPGRARERYAGLRTRAAVVHAMPHTRKGADAYMDAGVWIVDHCDLLVAVYDGRAPGRTGGTADVVHYARTAGRKLVQVDPLRRRVEG